MRYAISLLASCSLFAAACSNTDAGFDPDAVEDGFVVPADKADDFLSFTAVEFRVSGTSTVTLEESYRTKTSEEKLVRVRELIGLKQIAFAYFLTQFLVEKDTHDANASYGGAGGLAKAGDYDESRVRAVDELTYSFEFSQVISGRRDLLQRIPTTRRDGKTFFTLTIGTPTNDELKELETDAQWFRDPPWDDWNPATVPADKKLDIELEIAPEPASSDAWLEYPRLFEDGRFTIDVHFGYDYHAQYHLAHAKQLFNWLKNEMDFDAPVRRFDELTRTSGPFRKTLRANGADVAVEIRIFYPKNGPATDPDTDNGGRQLENDMRDSLRTADIVMFVGHSGPFYGFALANWKRTSEGDLSYEEIQVAEMPADRYQVVVADGCDTYALGAAFGRNPNKPGLENLDVITTTTFADASEPNSLMNFLLHVLDEDPQGNHRPRTAMSLLRDLRNANWDDAMYGIHGLNDNPRRHPYASLDVLCEECSRNSDCGQGGVCVEIGDEGKHCVVACTHDDGCPDDFQCMQVASRAASAIYAHACVPTALSCE